MSPLSRPRRLTPATTVLALLAAVIVGGWCLAPEGHSQAPAPSTPNAALSVMLGKLKTQEAAIAANQTKIEAQTALLKEELRQAKLYSARAGGHR